MQVKPYIYLLINESSWYIGVRIANKVPAFEDVEYMSSSKYIKARIAAGEIFTKHILGEYETREEASAAEDQYLREYWDVPGRVNKALGFKYEMDDEVREKHRKSLLGHNISRETRQKIAQSLIGGKRTKESKEKMRLVKLGKENKLKQKRCTIDGITIFASQKEAIKAIGTSRKTGVRSPNFKYVLE